MGDRSLDDEDFEYGGGHDVSVDAVGKGWAHCCATALRLNRGTCMLHGNKLLHATDLQCSSICRETRTTTRSLARRQPWCKTSPTTR